MSVETDNETHSLRARLGVRGSLLLAFFGIAAFAVLAAGFAMYGFVVVGTSLEQITQYRVPSTIASQKLSRQAERIAATAPAMLTVKTEGEREQLSAYLAAEFDKVEALLADLENRELDSASLVSIKVLVGRLDENVRQIDTMISKNLELLERLEKLRRELSFSQIVSRRLLAPGITVMSAKIAEMRRALEKNDNTMDARSQEIERLARPIVDLAPLQRLESNVSAINEGLIDAMSAESLSVLNVAVVSLRRSLTALQKSLPDVEPGLRNRLEARLTSYHEFIEDPDSIIGARSRQLRQQGLMQTLIDDNVEISQKLTEAVDQLVFSTDQAIQAANREAVSVQQQGVVVMLAVVAMSLACSSLIVWLYVGRSLIARLTGLSDSMLAIAGGELETPIPSGGSDEISKMANALKIFRDTAKEVRETNLREIREMRRRLTDAIESITEGFSLYDAEDKLVICNSRYRDDLYAGISDVMLSGVTFECVIRAAVERGLIEGVEQDAEAFIAKRLALHKNPSGPHLQQQSDGRWIQISERRTEDGGTVAVYSDITELIRHDQALAEKSNALEQLSNQLAKYLSPQVYDSIFSGRQEVKIASNRKKLTVFFSDIVGFTEVADRLESEDLSQLLNHYLTEMSNIALAHGATIDKFVGDAILIFFGDPETLGEKEDAVACVRMAIAMRQRLRDLEDIWRGSGIESPLQVRIGIHTGYCTVGNFGSEDRLDYTIIGGAVNTASRLEASAEPGEILISYNTFAHVRDEILCEERGEIEVKGIAYPVSTYRVVNTHSDLRRERQRFREEHHNALVDLDLDAMTTEDRVAAERMLLRALGLLHDVGEGPERAQIATND